MKRQSTDHIFMIEPAEFYSNPQTAGSNHYQKEDVDEDKSNILEKAISEFRAFRDKLVAEGVNITTFKGLQEEFGVTLELQDSGEVNVFGENKEVAEAAKAQIELLCAEPEEGKIYEGVVAKVVEFGAFVTFMPGKDGLLHISQFKQDFEHLTDVVNEGDKIKVRLAEIGRQGRLKLEFAED